MPEPTHAYHRYRWPEVAVPTTVIITSILSLLGVVVLATYGRQFDVTVNASTHLVYQVGEMR